MSGAINGSFLGQVERIGRYVAIFTYPDFFGTCVASSPIYLDNIPNGYSPTTNSNGIMSVKYSNSLFTFGIGILAPSNRLTVYASLTASIFIVGESVRIAKGAFVINLDVDSG